MAGPTSGGLSFGRGLSDIAPSSALIIGAGATVITGGSAGQLLYDTGGTLGETVGVTYATGGILNMAGGTVTASAPMLNITQTWNNAAVDFKAINVTITDTASTDASSLISLNRGGFEDFAIRRDGNGGILKLGANSNFSFTNVTNAVVGLYLGGNSWRFADGVCIGGTPGSAFTNQTFFTSSANGTVNIGITNGATDGTLSLASIILGTSFRLNVAPTAISSAAVTLSSSGDAAAVIGHRISLNFNGTTYWVPCSTTAF